MVRPLKRERAQAHALPQSEMQSPHLQVAEAGADAAVESPARRLQLEIEAALAEPQTPKWPLAARVGFIVGASLALWGGLIWGAVALS